MLPIDLKNDFNFNRAPKRKTGDTKDRPRREIFGAENISEKIRGTIRDCGMIIEVAVSRDKDAQANHTPYSIERTHVLPDGRKRAESRGASCIVSGPGINLCSQPANELRLMVHDRKHSGQEQQAARLNTLNIRAEGCRSICELNIQILQSFFGPCRW